ncbi:AAA family ATPase [Phytohabitans sp. ZYX-F-186]|uniref:AAA family ATPase n=1 Tax=Phytohabitans maris TaxID=3071409 RepID=A0ABU0ZD77_9ACTN|nr:AAA family ATPase [Phytohabitans sp. ZYX-F-186]MDQ7904265.1 AAA family ATPase [Phytohabitans sp. ZYX-F-186]
MEPVEGLRPPDEGPRDDNRPTRPKLPLWDRLKFVILLALLWLVLVWAAMADNPLLPFDDAARIQARDSIWIFVLIGLEVLRQIHFLVSERWSGYHHFWTHRFFGGIERVTHRRLSDWTRFRIARAIKWAFWIVVFALVAGAALDTSPFLALFQAPAILWQFLPLIVQIVLLMFVLILQFVALFWFLSRGGIETYYPDDIKTRFTDVWGQDHVLDRIRENLLFLEKPDAIEAKGGYVPGGILLWGPPGTGKTLMAEAMAGETGRPYVFVDPGAFTNMFMGVGILKVKSLFRKLRKLALRYGGVIVFFDEADSLGRRGALAQGGPGFPRGMRPAVFADGCHGFSYLSGDTRWLLTRNALAGAKPPPEDPDAGRNRVVMGNMGMGGGGDMGTLQALLSELSGLKKPRGLVNRYVRRLLGMRPKPPPKYRILTVMASNLPEALDEALLRPGRIDRIYKVGYPSKAGRMRTYQGYLDKVRHDLTEDEIDKLAVITPYATGATIKDLVNEALITAIRDEREVIEWRDVMQAKRLKQLGPPEDVEYIERERHAVAVHEACHAVAAYRTRYHMEIDIATIEKGAEYLGMVASIKPEDQFTRWRTEYESDIYVSLASLAGERMFFEGDSSSGVSGDLEHATTVATQMEGFWGMGSTVSSYAASAQIGTGTPGGRGPGNREDPEDVARRALADRIEDNLNTHLERVVELLEANRREILTLAHALETHKTLTGEDVVAVLERRPGPLVDGTVYQREELLREIEDYHRAAVAAHRGHAKVTVLLPSVPAVTATPDAAWRPPDAITAASPNGGSTEEGAAPDGEAPAEAAGSPNGSGSAEAVVETDPAGEPEAHPNGASGAPKTGEPEAGASGH